MIAFAQSPRKDGNAWLDMPDGWKTMTIVGMFEGIKLGGDFSMWKIMRQGQGKPNPTLKAVMDSFDEYNAYFDHVTVGQMVAGLDDLYSDYRNRSILIRYAVWIVANSISGTPKEKVESMTQTFRKAGAKP